MSSDVDTRVSVVVLTHNRADELERTLGRLAALPERPPLVVVDNASDDDTAARVRLRHPGVTLVRCSANFGAAGRNVGVAEVRTPYVAFCDDDTWWEPGALVRAADILDAYPRLGAIAARVLVGDTDEPDPACVRMAASPLHRRGLPGPALIAFMAGAVVMRAAAFRQAGGYEPRLFLGAEEMLMALDLAALRWDMVYIGDVVTHHHPSPSRNLAQRRIVSFRNRLWIVWSRFPLASALRESALVLREAHAAGVAGPSLREALAGMRWALAHRNVLPMRVVAMYRRVFRPMPVHCPQRPIGRRRSAPR
jgi:GT2 family glycosyltransferase